MKIKTTTVMDKYQDWSKILIEPTSLNDARLYSLEARIHEEEEIRIKDYDFIKDAIKKLVYSIEQQSINHIDEGLVSQQDQMSKSMAEGFSTKQTQQSTLKAKSGTSGTQVRDSNKHSNSNYKNLLNSTGGPLNKSHTPILPNLLGQNNQMSIKDNLKQTSVNDSLMAGSSIGNPVGGV
jgi:hypothetical protein